MDQTCVMTISPTAPTGFNLTVRDVADAAGIAPSAVRFYEAHGLITAHRTAGNQRRFDDNAACLIKIARVAQRVGLTVRDIAEIFAALPDDPQSEDWDTVAEIMINEAESRTAALRDHLEGLRSGSRLCDL
jgi:MerR family redox-sensitive transcriptional activator SoxR